MSRVAKAQRKLMEATTAEVWDSPEPADSRDETSEGSELPWKLQEVVGRDSSDQLCVEQVQATTVEFDPMRPHLVTLVRRVFLPPPVGAGLRSVLFCAADGSNEVTRTGRACAHVLAAQTSKHVCLLDTSAKVVSPEHDEAAPSTLTSAPRPSGNLWIASSAHALVAMPADTMTRQMRELQGRFDHLVACAPAMDDNEEPTALASLVEGVILVVDEERTRRDVARHTAAVLESAGARLVGVVLANQSHPIPAAIYERL